MNTSPHHWAVPEHGALLVKSDNPTTLSLTISLNFAEVIFSALSSLKHPGLFLERTLKLVDKLKLSKRVTTWVLRPALGLVPADSSPAARAQSRIWPLMGFRSGNGFEKDRRPKLPVRAAAQTT